MQGSPFSCETSRIRFPLLPRSPALSTKACPRFTTSIPSSIFPWKNLPTIPFSYIPCASCAPNSQPVTTLSHPFILTASPPIPPISPFIPCMPRPFSPITPMKKQVTTVITILKRSFKLNLFSRLKYFFNNLIKVLLLVMPVQNPKAHHRRCLLMQLTLYHFRHFFCLRQTARTANSKQPPEYA